MMSWPDVHQILVLDQESHDAPAGVAVDLVEALHDLDQADYVARLDDVALARRTGLPAGWAAGRTCPAAVT